MTRNERAPMLGEATLQELRASLQGDLIRPGDPGYDNARAVWNGMIDKRPALIVRCVDADDVVRAVQFARSHDLLVAVRGGGHNVAGTAMCDDGLVVDLSRMKGLRVDPIARTARAEPGLTLNEFIRGTEEHGLVTPVGTISGTGIAGLTLGGGMGWLMGKHGLTVDNLLSVEMVTADGRRLAANSTEHPDLFWAVRGGGGNFGVVTSFTYRLHRLEGLLGGMVIHPADRAKEVLRFYRDYTREVPDELTAYAIFATTPDGQPIIALGVAYCGSIDEGERLVAPVRHFGHPIADLIRPMSYLDLITMVDATAPDGWSYYEKSCGLERLTDAAVDALVEYGAAPSSPLSQVLIQHVHGVAARVGPAETAVFGLRGEHYEVSIIAAWNGGDAEPHIAWARDYWQSLEPYATGAVYINTIGDEGEERVKAAYGPNYPRLAAIKRAYDPTNFFRVNQNIRPAPGP